MYIIPVPDDKLSVTHRDGLCLIGYQVAVCEIFCSRYSRSNPGVLLIHVTITLYAILTRHFLVVNYSGTLG